MDQLPPSLEQLIQELSRLPSIGPKTAQRLAFHILRSDRTRTDALAQAIVEIKTRIGYCERCFNIAEGPCGRPWPPARFGVTGAVSGRGL